MLTGPSAAGKSTIAEQLQSEGICQWFRSDHEILIPIMDELERPDLKSVGCPGKVWRGLCSAYGSEESLVGRVREFHEELLPGSSTPLLAEGWLYSIAACRDLLLQTVFSTNRWSNIAFVVFEPPRDVCLERAKSKWDIDAQEAKARLLAWREFHSTPEAHTVAVSCQTTDEALKKVIRGYVST